MRQAGKLSNSTSWHSVSFVRDTIYVSTILREIKKNSYDRYVKIIPSDQIIFKSKKVLDMGVICFSVESSLLKFHSSL